MDIDLAALRALEREREISFRILVDAIKQALLAAYHHTAEANPRARIDIDERTGRVSVIVTEVDEDDNPVEERDDTPSGFGRVAAATARQVIFQRLRELEDQSVLGEYAGKTGDVVSGVVQQGPNPAMIHLDLGTIEAILPPHEQVPTERYQHGRRMRALVTEAKRGFKGPSVTVSRTHPNFVKKLFALEVPEIADGSVEIVALVRESGHRTKMAVRATKAGINPKGSCIGPMGARVRSVTRELDDEKIDIVDYDDDPTRFIANALSPSRVLSVSVVDPATRSARAIVPDFQYSLAIGKDGQNARLAAKLTGWRIDIRPDTEPEPATGT